MEFAIHQTFWFDMQEEKCVIPDSYECSFIFEIKDNQTQGAQS